MYVEIVSQVLVRFLTRMQLEFNVAPRKFSRGVSCSYYPIRKENVIPSANSFKFVTKTKQHIVKGHQRD